MRALGATVLLMMAGTAYAADAPAPAPPASAKRLPAPDPSRGERYDGRPAAKTSAKELLLVVPRFVLAVPRLILKGAGLFIRPLMERGERNHDWEKLSGMFTSDDGQVGVRPVFDFHLSFKIAVGVSYFNNRLGHGNQLTISTAVGGIDVIQHHFHDRLPILPPALHAALDFDADYERRSEALFTGIGGQPHLPVARYAYDRVDVGVGLSMAPAQHLSFGVSSRFGLRRFGDGIPYSGNRPIGEVYCERRFDGRCLPGGGIDESKVPGFAAGTQFMRQAATVHVDSRKLAHRDRSGIGADFTVQYSHGLGSDRSHYVRVDGSVAGDIVFFRHRTLHLSFAAADEIQIGSTPIPFSELVTLGGPEDLRGYRRNRFRDHSSVVATAEYRYPVWMWMDASVFVDYGGVFGPQFRGASFANMRPDVGIGVRIHSSDKFVMRIQVAYGWGDGGETRLVFTASPGR